MRHAVGTVGAVIGLVALLASAGCGAGTGAVRGTGSATPTAAATPSVSATAFAGRVLRSDGIGELRVGSTPKQLATLLGGTSDVATPVPGCTFATFSGTDAADPLPALLSTLAGSDETGAPVDVIGFGDQLAGAAPPDGLPRTAEGIGMGSTAAEVRAAYPTGLRESPSAAMTGYTELRLDGAAGTGFAFLVNTDGVVEQISVGRLTVQDRC